MPVIPHVSFFFLVNMCLPDTHIALLTLFVSFLLVTPSEITIGTILGRGGFCTVSEISKVKLADGGKSAAVHHHDDEDEEEQLGFAGGQAIIQDRAFIAQRCLVSYFDPIESLRDL